MKIDKIILIVVKIIALVADCAVLFCFVNFLKSSQVKQTPTISKYNIAGTDSFLYVVSYEFETLEAAREFANEK